MSRLGSPQVGSRRVAIAKPKNDIYVALLGIALGAVLIACILLMLEMSDYEWTVNPKVAMAPSSAAPLRHDVASARGTPPSDHGGAPDIVSVTG